MTKPKKHVIVTMKVEYEADDAKSFRDMVRTMKRDEMYCDTLSSYYRFGNRKVISVEKVDQ